MRDVLDRRRGHDAEKGKGDLSQYLPILDGYLATARSDERACCDGHILVRVSDDKQVVRIMGHGLGKRAVDAEAFREGAGMTSACVVAVEDEGLEDIL